MFKVPADRKLLKPKLRLSFFGGPGCFIVLFARILCLKGF